MRSPHPRCSSLAISYFNSAAFSGTARSSTSFNGPSITIRYVPQLPTGQAVVPRQRRHADAINRALARRGLEIRRAAISNLRSVRTIFSYLPERPEVSRDSPHGALTGKVFRKNTNA